GGVQRTRGEESDRSLLQRGVEKGRMTADEIETALTRVHQTTELTEAVVEADFVIEAVVERLDAKLRVFAELGRLAPAHAILASHSSTLGLPKPAPASGPPDRLCNKPLLHPPLVQEPVQGGG